MANGGTTNIPAPSFGPNGFIVPSGPAILAGRQQDYNVAFNVTFNWNQNTPQGQLAASDAAAIANTYDLFQYYTQQVDPAFASGRMQDAIGRIYFITRDPAEPTTLLVDCTGGGAGTPITLPDISSPRPATIQDESGNLYQLQTSITLPASGGTVVGTFACTVPGPVPVPTADEISIYTAGINGWDSVSVVSGTQGVNTEGRQAFELRRSDSVAGNSAGAIGSVIGAVAKVPGVTDYYGYDNGDAFSVTVKGVTIAANSIYVCVAGGASLAVAQAILSKKGPGCGYTGTTVITAYDNNPLYSAPVPYTVKFTYAAPLQLLFAVELVNSPQIPSNAATLVQNALVAAVTQGILGSGAVFTGAISGSTLTVSAISSGTLASGQTLIDATNALAPETVILSQVSGTTGGTGVYMVSPPQNVSAETMTALAQGSSALPSLRARIASVVYGTAYTAAINALGSWAQVASISIGSANTPGAVFTGRIAGTTLTIVNLASGTIAIGQTLSDTSGLLTQGTVITAGSGSSWTVNNTQTVGGASFTGTASGTALTASSVTGTIQVGATIAGTGVPSGTTIIAQVSGTAGGAGVYTTSASTTASSASITTSDAIIGATANQSLVSVQANQEPQLLANNIAVTLTS